MNYKEKNWKLGDILYLIIGKIQIEKVGNDILNQYAVKLENFDLDDPSQFDFCLSKYHNSKIDTITSFQNVTIITLF